MKALSATTAREKLARLPEGWAIKNGKRLERTYRFPDFKAALAFVNRVGALAEREAHHPDIHLSWGKAKVSITTHDAGGLTGKDFGLAAKIGD